MEIKLTVHRSLILAREDGNSEEKLLNQEIYCRRLHLVVKPKESECHDCCFFKGREKDRYYECEWDDVETADTVIPHENRYREYERVDILIKLGVLKAPGRMSELWVKNKIYDPEAWIYAQDQNRRNRYILGTKGKNPLVCFGVNPSTASPEDLDNTMRNVSRISGEKGYDSYLMLNLYPQRATNPDDMDREADREAMKRNLYYIESVLKTGGRTIWAAWGNLIMKRSYLRECLREIVRIADAHSCRWITIGNRSGGGHPHHPLYMPKDAKAVDFDVHKYLNDL